MTCHDYQPPYFQGVLKIRKRVTLTAVTVSTIFSICWVTDAVIFLLSYHSTTNSPSDVTWAIAAVMILFNSAVNPFVYALINERFREKIKRLITYRPHSAIQASGFSESPSNLSGQTLRSVDTNSRIMLQRASNIAFFQQHVIGTFQIPK